MKRILSLLAALACCWIVGCGKEEAAAPKNEKKPTLNVEPTTVTATTDEATSPVTDVASLPSDDGSQFVDPSPSQPDANFSNEDLNQDDLPPELQKPIIDEIPIDFTPEQVVSTFLEALCEGDKVTTSVLLTDRAREETTKQGLAIQPIGSSSAKYEVAKAQYPPGQADGAWVNTVWTETSLDNEQVQFETMWALRRQVNGWRIVGMAARVSPEQPSRFFNFEEPQELVKELQRGQPEAAPEGGNTVDGQQPQTPSQPTPQPTPR